MDIVVYAALGTKGGEHDLAYKLLAAALKRELGLSELPEMAREDGGKPYFSHSHGAAVCALHDTPGGVDIEKLRPAPRRLAEGMADEAFFRLWTAKEATIKRQGGSVAALLRPMEPDGLCQCLEGLLEGYTVTVCPSEKAAVRAKVISQI